MEALIIGGGIGGLTAGLFLHSQGIGVRIFEAVPQIRELGVGINSLPHALRELDRLGLLGEVVAAGIPTQELAYFNKHGQLIWAEPRGLKAGYNWPQVSINRGRLQGVLLKAAQARIGTDRIKAGHRFISLEEHDSKIVATFENGATAEGDVLIGADGIHSAVRRIFYPNQTPHYSGTCMWRSTSIGKPFRTGATMAVIGHHMQKFTTYPITPADGDGNAVINWLARIPVPELPGPEDWNAMGKLDDIVKHYETWRFDWLDVPALMKRAKDVYVYPMIDRDPVPQWTFGRATLLGDAAHPMYPIGSNGGSQAILDASALGAALGANAADPLKGLAAYEGVRRPATDSVVQANRGFGPEVVMEWAEERAPQGFKRIEDVISADELEQVATRYRQTAGFDKERLNASV